MTGCASQYGPRLTRVQHFPDCYQPIYDLRQAEHRIARTTVGSAAVGTGLGALIGLVIADNKKQRTTHALAGAAAGGVIGGMAGAMYSNKQQIKDENARMYSYLQDLDGDIHNLNIASASAMTSLQCYDKKFESTSRMLVSRQLPKPVAYQMFNEIQSGRTEALSILDKTEQSWRVKNVQYNTAIHEEKRHIQTVDAKAKVVAAEKKSQEFNQKIHQVSQNKIAASARTQADSRKVQQMLAEIDA